MAVRAVKVTMEHPKPSTLKNDFQKRQQPHLKSISLARSKRNGLVWALLKAVHP